MDNRKKPPLDVKYTLGGIFMSRNQKRISNYEKEILELREEGLTNREIGVELGFSKEQIKGFIKRRNKKIRTQGIEQIIPKKSKTCKSINEIPPSIQKLDNLAQMRYVIANKDRYIKQLEMENELMRDFLSLTERK